MPHHLFPILRHVFNNTFKQKMRLGHQKQKKTPLTTRWRRQNSLILNTIWPLFIFVFKVRLPKPIQQVKELFFFYRKTSDIKSRKPKKKKERRIDTTQRRNKKVFIFTELDFNQLTLTNKIFSFRATKRADRAI